MLNFLVILVITLLTMYAPIELTRVIIAWGLAPQFIFELWFTYTCGILSVSLWLWVLVNKTKAVK